MHRSPEEIADFTENFANSFHFRVVVAESEERDDAENGAEAVEERVARILR